jgi:hypothetical protein
MLFYIKAKVTVRVNNISGPFEDTKTYLVNAPELEVAKSKFKRRIEQDCNHMLPGRIEIQYLEIGEEIG